MERGLLAIRLVDKIRGSIYEFLYSNFRDGVPCNMDDFITIYINMHDEKNGLVLINVKKYLNIVYKKGVKLVDDGLIQDTIILKFALNEKNLEKGLLGEDFIYIQVINHNYDAYDSLDKFFSCYNDNKNERASIYKIIKESLLFVRKLVILVEDSISFRFTI